MKKLAVYTGLFTDDPNKLYGDIIHYEHEKDGVDYVAFTNSDHLKSDFWDVRKMDTWRNGRWTARKCKTSPQELLPDYDAWLWMDNQLFFTYDPRSFMTHYLTMADLSAHFHCDRKYDCTTAILYMNTNNGYTLLGEKEKIKIKSEENTMLIFNSQIKHCAVSQTDTERRVVINFNYI